MLPYIGHSQPVLAGLVLLNLQDVSPLSNLLLSQSSIEVQKGQEITIKMPGTPSTGYQWRLKSNTCGSGLVREGQPTFYRDSFLGNGLEGVYYFKFKAADEGSNGMKCNLEFIYA